MAFLARSCWLSSPVFLLQILSIPIWMREKPKERQHTSFSTNPQNLIPCQSLWSHSSCYSKTQMWIISSRTVWCIILMCAHLMARNVTRIWTVPRNFPRFCGQYQLFLDLIHFLSTFLLPNPVSFFKALRKYTLKECFKIIIEI